MEKYVCKTCGKSFAGGVAGGDRCPACKGSDAPAAGRDKAFEYFRRHPGITEADIAGRSVGASAPLMVAGFAVVFAGVFIGSCVDFVVSLLGCIVALIVVDKAMFRRVHPLDRFRWGRFWNGAVLGYWLAYVPLALLLAGALAQRGSQELADMVWLGAFPLACLIGMGVGFINLARTSAAGKQEVLGYFRAFQAQSAPPPVLQPADAAPAEPARLDQTAPLPPAPPDTPPSGGPEAG